MSFLIAFLAAAAAFLIYTSTMEFINQRKEAKFALYDDITTVDDEEIRAVKAYESRSPIERLKVILESSNAPFDLQEYLIIIGASFLFITFIAYSFIGNFFGGAVIGLAPAIASYMWMKNAIKNRNKKVVRQLPDFAVMFASGYESGRSIENCFDYCAKELRFPINTEMADIFKDITDRKLSLVASLNNWYERNPNPDILFVIKGLLLCQEKAGDVTTIMRSLQEKLRDRAHVDRFVQKRTQNLRYTAKFIQAVPIITLVFSYISNPAKFMLFATSVVGAIGFGIMAFMYIMGTLLIRKFINNVYKD